MTCRLYSICTTKLGASTTPTLWHTVKLWSQQLRPTPRYSLRTADPLNTALPRTATTTVKTCICAGVPAAATRLNMLWLSYMMRRSRLMMSWNMEDTRPKFCGSPLLSWAARWSRVPWMAYRTKSLSATTTPRATSSGNTKRKWSSRPTNRAKAAQQLWLQICSFNRSNGIPCEGRGTVTALFIWKLESDHERRLVLSGRRSYSVHNIMGVITVKNDRASGLCHGVWRTSFGGR